MRLAVGGRFGAMLREWDRMIETHLNEAAKLACRSITYLMLRMTPSVSGGFMCRSIMWIG